MSSSVEKKHLTITVSEDDWSKRLGGYRCEVFKMPGATIHNILVNGIKQDDNKYQVDTNLEVIRWCPPEQRPQEVTVAYTLSEDPNSKELSIGWKKFGPLNTVVGSLLAALLGGFFVLQKRRFHPFYTAGKPSSLCVFSCGNSYAFGYRNPN